MIMMMHFHLVEELQRKNYFSFITIDNEDKEMILTNIMYNKDKEIFELLEMSSKTSEFDFKAKSKHECIEYMYKHKDKIKKSSCILI